MDAKTKKKLITLLRAERERVAAELDEVNEATELMEQDATPAGVSSHLAEEANATTEIEKNLAVKQTLSGLLSDIDHALARNEAGNYGLCENCGQEINPERLEFVPHAVLCVQCKGKLERAGNGYR